MALGRGKSPPSTTEQLNIDYEWKAIRSFYMYM